MLPAHTRFVRIHAPLLNHFRDAATLIRQVDRKVRGSWEFFFFHGAHRIPLSTCAERNRKKKKEEDYGELTLMWEAHPRLVCDRYTSR